MEEKNIKQTKDIELKKKTKKIPKEISQEIIKRIFKNLLNAIFIMLYFVILNLAYDKINHDRLANDIQVFAGMFLLTGIVFLEKAYKNDNGQIAITAIELLVMSMHTLSIIHMTALFKYDFKIYLLVSSYFFSIYYILKSIIIYTKGRKQYLNTLSDISEIVQKDEPVKKEAKKRNSYTEENEQDTREGDTESKPIMDKKNKAEKIKEKSKNKVKTVKSKDEERKNKMDSNKKEEPKRKRGRPKKEVDKND